MQGTKNIQFETIVLDFEDFNQELDDLTKKHLEPNDIKVIYKLF